MMGIESELEREEEFLCEQLNNCEITQQEFNEQMDDLYRGYRAEAEEAAHDAYENEMNRWY